MIIQEHVVVNGHEYIYTHSDERRYIVGGAPEGQYIEAYDPAEFDRQYVEGDLIPEEEIGED